MTSYQWAIFLDRNTGYNFQSMLLTNCASVLDLERETSIADNGEVSLMVKVIKHWPASAN